MKRQRGRNRGGGSGGGGGGGKPQQNANRAFDSNGPDNIKVRGHAQHVFEKYQQLSRDATSSGDRVLAENFLQHAEHYFRVLRTLQPNRPIAEFVARDSFSGYDIDFEDESGAQALQDETPMDGAADGQGESGEPPRGDFQSRDPREGRWESRQNGQNGQSNGQRDGTQRDGTQRDGGQRDGGQRDGGQRDDRGSREGRDRDRNRFDRDRPRDDRGYPAEGQSAEPRDTQGERVRDDRPREDRGGYRDRDRSPRDDRAAAPSDDRYRNDRGERRERVYEPRAERADPLAVVEPQARPLTAEAPPPAPVPNTPVPNTPVPNTPVPNTPVPIAPVSTADEGASVLRSRDGETSQAPAFLQAAPPPSGDDAPPKRPRGRPRKIRDPASEEA